MKKSIWLLLGLISANITVEAKNLPLRIAVSTFTPPFVMQGHNQLYGFDIAMMLYICNTIHRDCTYQTMPFDQLLTTIATNKADIAVSGITITIERYTLINFSIPYMISNTRFIGKIAMANTTINANLLSTARIGTIQGNIFDNEILSLGALRPKIVHFDRETVMIEALIDGSIDLALLDEPSAIYWKQTMKGKLVTLGKSIAYGSGLGIAINKDQTDLADTINQAIRQYQTSDDFKTNYNSFLRED